MNEANLPAFKIPGFNKGVYTNDRKCAVVHNFIMVGGERYLFDFELCASEDGWKQYDTDQDAWYFGVWVRRGTLEVVEYAEGDVYHSTAPDEETFTALLASMAETYGPPPPAFIAYDGDGTRTEYYDERPA